MSGVGTIIDRPECLSIVPCLHDNAAKKGSRTKKRYHCSKPLLSLRFLHDFNLESLRLSLSDL